MREKHVRLLGRILRMSDEDSGVGTSVDLERGRADMKSEVHRALDWRAVQA